MLRTGIILIDKTPMSCAGMSIIDNPGVIEIQNESGVNCRIVWHLVAFL